MDAHEGAQCPLTRREPGCLPQEGEYQAARPEGIPVRAGREGQSPYAVALDAARDTIVERARFYKRLVIGVSLCSLVVAGSIIGWRSAWPLLALAWLPALVLVHRIADLRAVHRWRDISLIAWVAGQLELDLLASTLRRVPGLPPSTVEGMLESLPCWPGNTAPSVRSSLVRAQWAIGRLATQALAVRALAWSTVAATVLAAVCAAHPGWLAGLAGAAMAVPAWTLWAARRVPRMVDALRASLHASVGEPESLHACLDQFNWQGVPARHRAAWAEASNHHAHNRH